MKKFIVILTALAFPSVYAQPSNSLRQDKMVAREYIKSQIAGENLKVRMKYSNVSFDKLQSQMTKKGFNSKKVYFVFSSDTLSERTIIWREETPTIGGKSKPFVFYNISRTDSISILCLLFGN
jgi:hypothetical protein